MKLRVKIYDLFFFIYSGIFLMPSFFSNGITNALNNVCFLVAIYYLVKIRYKFSKLDVAMLLFILYQLAISFYMNVESANIHMILSSLKIIVYLMYFKTMINKRKKSAITPLLIIIGIYVVIDFLSIILFPNGLYFRATVENEWTTTEVAQWIFGNKNNRIYWYVLFELLLVCKYYTHPKKILKILMWITVICTEFAMILVHSSTATIVALISGIGIVLSCHKKVPKKEINSKHMIFLYLLLNVLFIFGLVEFLNPLVNRLFGKDLTFTGRTTIWAGAILCFLEKPIFGRGHLSGAEAGQLFGHLFSVNAHNELLDILVQGGIILFVLFLHWLWVISKDINKIHNSELKFCSVIIFFSFLVEMLTEAILGNAIWILFFVLCNLHQIEESQAKPQYNLLE